ncbi:aqualysin-1-like [Amphiura filiformis]|uniref:aqualysin-1-like n=1 Tax=Amphiura filiformis TaxID=82378 RepID=UPI003B213113
MKVLVFCVFIALASGSLAPLHRVSERVPGNYMVHIKKGLHLDDFIANSFSVSLEGQILHKYEHIGHGIAVRIPDHLVDVLRSLDGVEYVAEDGVVYTQQVASWGLDRVDQRYLPLDNIFTPPRTGSGTTIYVIDTGILHSHKDFGGRVTNLYDFEPGNNGADCNGHGTHCAGTAAGSTFGVAKGADIKSVRFMGCTGSGLWTDMLDGLDLVVADITPTMQKVASMSVGGGKNPFVDQYVADAIAAGVVVSAAAGNSNANACNYSPSGVLTAITVGATDDNDKRASYSNYGNCVDVFAPGTSIVSTWIDSDTSTYTLSGTSMACPHVSGAAALLLERGVAPSNVPDEMVATATGVVTNPGSGSPNLMLYVN